LDPKKRDVPHSEAEQSPTHENEVITRLLESAKAIESSIELLEARDEVVQRALEERKQVTDELDRLNERYAREAAEAVKQAALDPAVRDQLLAMNRRVIQRLMAIGMALDIQLGVRSPSEPKG